MTYFYRPTPPRNPVIDNRTWSVLSDDFNSQKLFASCDREEDAALIVRALNYLDLKEFNWSCGHVAGAVCGQCHDELIERANGLAAKLLEDGGENEQRVKNRT